MTTIESIARYQRMFHAIGLNADQYRHLLELMKEVECQNEIEFWKRPSSSFSRPQ